MFLRKRARLSEEESDKRKRPVPVPLPVQGNAVRILCVCLGVRPRAEHFPPRLEGGPGWWPIAASSALEDFFRVIIFLGAGSGSSRGPSDGVLLLLDPSVGGEKTCFFPLHRIELRLQEQSQPILERVALFAQCATAPETTERTSAPEIERQLGDGRPCIRSQRTCSASGGREIGQSLRRVART